MKFYDCATAPSPRRVRVFLAEKGIEVPTIQVDLGNREQFSDAYQELNPNGVVPLLILDDGRQIGESVAICRYFEKKHPEPPLMGIDAEDEAEVEMWQRRAEFEGFLAVAEAFRNTAPGLAGRALPGVKDEVAQIPELGERGKQTTLRLFAKLDKQLTDNEFIAGPRYTIADITTLCTVDFCKWIKLDIAPELSNLQRWYDAVSARASASA